MSIYLISFKNIYFNETLWYLGRKKNSLAIYVKKDTKSVNNWFNSCVIMYVICLPDAVGG